jgi:phosphohistidine phosphatase
MIVFLLRHADAVPGEPDAGRLLSAKGRRQSARVGRGLGLEDWPLVRALEHSPLCRSVETAQLVKSAAKLRQPLQVLAGLEPEADARVTAAQLARTRTARFLVGHNPHLATLVGLLLGLRDGAEGIHFRKAALLSLERLTGPTARKPYGTWRLKSLVPPPAGK